jgi:uncharacterized protein YjgD (DUF1641 family)
MNDRERVAGCLSDVRRRMYHLNEAMDTAEKALKEGTLEQAGKWIREASSLAEAIVREADIAENARLAASKNESV